MRNRSSPHFLSLRSFTGFVLPGLDCVRAGVGGGADWLLPDCGGFARDGGADGRAGDEAAGRAAGLDGKRAGVRGGAGWLLLACGGPTRDGGGGAGRAGSGAAGVDRAGGWFRERFDCFGMNG